MVAEFQDLWHEGGGNNVGAMCWRTHVPDAHDADPRPMPHLAVMTPIGVFCIDCPETDPPYGKWQRSGEPPNVSVTPSININDGQWHGYLTSGEFVP